MTWLAAARRRNQRLGAIPYDTGQNAPRRLDLRNTGYLQQMRLEQTINFIYATAGPTSQDQLGQYGGALNRVTLQANSVGLLFDTSGASAAFISAINGTYKEGASPLQPIPTSYTTSPGTSATTDKWVYDIPVALEMVNKPWPIGFFQTALNSQETSIEVRWNPVAATAGAPGTGLYTGNPSNNTAANNTGSLDMQQIYFDPIADPQSQPSLAWIHQWREWQMPLGADGTSEITLPPSNFYTRLIYTVVTGSAGALALESGLHLTKLSLLYGANLAPFDEPYDAVLYRMNHDYNFVLPPGILVHDFLQDSHTERDTINSAATTNLRTGITLAGATYSGGAYVKIAAEQLIPLQVPAPNTAGVQGVAA